MADWYIVSTNPRCEDRAAASIKEAGFEAYAPKLPKLVIHHRSKKAIRKEFNLLVGYIFVALPERDPPFGFVRQCDGVKAFVGVQNRPLSITDAQLAEVEYLESSVWLDFDQQFRSQKSTKPRRRRLPARPVNIRTGPLSGFVGHILDDRDKRAVKVITSMFETLHEITVPLDQLEQAA